MADGNLAGVRSFKWLGIAMIVLGLIAILSPAVAGQAVVLVIGFVMLVVGVVQLVRGFQAETWRQKIPTLVLGGITTLCGLLVLGHPFLGLSFLTLLLVVYLVVEGVWAIIASFHYRSATGWLWLLASGVLSLLLGILIWNQWPISGLWAIGVLIGVNLLSTGVAFVSLASTTEDVADRAETLVGGDRE